MAYDRNDRRPGGYSSERGGFGGDNSRNEARTESYGNYGGSGARDYRGERSNDDGRRDYGRDPRGYDYDRGFFERAGDEVRSWFGDDEAERRRRDDERRYQAENRSGERTGNDWGSRNSGYGDQGHGSQGADRSFGNQASGGQGAGGYGERSYGGSQAAGSDWGRGGQRDQGSHHDASYHSWRDRQMQSFDRDYDDYRRENQSRFDQEFHSWRQGRQGQRDLLGKVKEHQDVVGSDGQHVGAVDHVRGDDIKLTKSDEAAGGHHHLIPVSWIQSVDDKVTLNKTADQAKQHWRDADRDSNGGMFGRGEGSGQGGSPTAGRTFGDPNQR